MEVEAFKGKVMIAYCPIVFDNAIKSFNKTPHSPSLA